MFEKIIGHEESKEILTSDIQNAKVSHAYLFSGIEGVGKKELALEFAKVLLNTENLATCVDFKYIDKLPDKKDIIVEQVREKIVNDVYVAPATCNYKVYIINDAHLMNGSAQNALLKTLEEPPHYVVIILITHSEEELLTTVISRVKPIKFKALKSAEIDLLTEKEVGKKLEEDSHEYANGSLKIALELLKDDNKYDKINTCFSKIKNKDKLGIMKALEEVNFKDDETFKYFEYLFLKNSKYEAIPIVEYARRRMLENANDDIVKQAFMIKMLRKE